MQVQISTTNAVEGSLSLKEDVERIVRHALHHVSAHLTRVEVHLDDEAAGKEGRRDMRCTVEARLEGRDPTVVTENAETLEEAVRNAAETLNRAVGKTIERRRGH